MILVPLTINAKQSRMQADKQTTADTESNDRNRQEPHDPAQAGREAIEAGRLNDRNKPAEQQRRNEASDAEQWRNEG